MQAAIVDANSNPIAPAPEASRADNWSPWVFHLGPLSIGSDGIDLKPQLKIGGQYGNFVAETGFSDVRDGLKFDMGCSAFVDAAGVGASIAEAHVAVKQAMKNNVADAGSMVSTMAEKLGCDTSCASRQAQDVLGDALDVAGQLFSGASAESYSRLAEIAKTLGVDLADLQKMLEGHGAEPGSIPIKLNVRATTGMGVSGKMCLGWSDLEGYHMIGCGGRATTLVAMGLEVFAGRHSSGIGARIILGVGNFTLEYTFPHAVLNANSNAAAEKQMISAS